MVRQSRLQTRISLLLVICAALFGAWFAAANFQVEPGNLTTPTLAENSDWIDAVSAVGEQVIQFFLGWTSAR